jgi:hypothetical protein
MAAGADTYSAAVTYRAAVRETTISPEASETVDRTVRDLDVWLDDVDGTVSAGNLVTVTACRDLSLIGVTGTVLTVERDSIRAVRRCVVRAGNDA